MKRLSIVALFAAWFCASGSMLDVVQVFAWGRMFSQYTQTMSVAAAAIETMDVSKPCAICMALRRARQESSQRELPAGIASSSVKIDLVFHEVPTPILARDLEAWLETGVATPRTRTEPVPTPPPRSATANVLIG